MYKMMKMHLHIFHSLLFFSLLVLPTDRPSLRITKTEGRIGDQIYVSCNSSKSKPAGTLGLFINGEPVSYLE